MRTAQEIAASYNRLLLNIYYGEDTEYGSIEEYIESLYGTVEPQYVQERDGRSMRTVGVKLTLAGGGPTVWLDTADGMLYASTSGDCVGVGLFSEVRDEINDIFGVEY